MLIPVWRISPFPSMFSSSLEGTSPVDNGSCLVVAVGSVSPVSNPKWPPSCGCRFGSSCLEKPSLEETAVMMMFGISSSIHAWGKTIQTVLFVFLKTHMPCALSCVHSQKEQEKVDKNLDSVAAFMATYCHCFNFQKLADFPDSPPETSSNNRRKHSSNRSRKEGTTACTLNWSIKCLW